MLPNPKNEQEKIVKLDIAPTITADALEINEGNVLYKMSVAKFPKVLLVWVEIMNNSESAILVDPEKFHASESQYSLRYISLGEILAYYQGVIDLQAFRWQNARQQAITTDSYSFNARATTTTITGNVGPNPYEQLGKAIGMAIVSHQVKKNIQQAQQEAQWHIDTSLAPATLLPNTRCKGKIIFERQTSKGDVRVDLVENDRIISFNFKDAPFFGHDFSNSPIIDKLIKDGSIYAAGLRKGDRVISIDGKPVSSLTEFMEIGRTYPIGTTVKVEYQKRYEKTIKTIDMKMLPPPE